MREKQHLTFVSNCAAGLEHLVNEEIHSFNGEEVQSFTGGVRWQGGLETAYRMCLWSRYASRVLLEIKSFDINDADDLYSGCTKIAWNEHLHQDLSFAVTSSLAADAVLSHSQYAALRVKDAVVDFFREQGLQRPNVAKDRPDLRIYLHIKKNRASIFIDLSGESLHKRGYRKATGIAPLKETLAAAIVTLSGWNKDVSSKQTLLDPMCGSATLLIEAALIYGDSAPGLSRTYYGFSHWLGHRQELWSTLVAEALQREEAGLRGKWPRIIGYDSDPEMVAVARSNIENAGLEERIEIKCRDIAFLQSPSQQGFIISNLPYGERLSEKNRVRYLYSCVGRKMGSLFQGWQAGLFIADPDIADTLGIRIDKSHKLYNGPIVCRLLTGDITASSSSECAWHLAASEKPAEGDDFANRLRKNMKKLSNWTKKHSISCYRVYDRDLPDYNVTVDIYDKWIVVQEYLPPSTIESGVAEKRFGVALQVLRQVFGIKRERIFIRRRQRQRGKSQYEKKEGRPKFYEVREGGCSFLVNFTTYLDIGLFLDHRPIRMKLQEMAQGKRFLNLYGYTGTATVHAAAGGAALTTTVDLSANYLEWARNNLSLNGFSEDNHEMVQQDCFTWLGEAQGRYDIIFIDPPTFSNSKKKKRVFDIQRDHAELIRRASALLDNGGVLFFSTNSSRFTLDTWVEEAFQVTDISAETIPFDFKRNRKVHSCWKLTQK
jgi:23S rRNA (guanine2445-N2)-methyltransferase / 23S rRNA (guanine2069-N7)-methyltransferase